MSFVATLAASSTTYKYMRTDRLSGPHPLYYNTYGIGETDGIVWGIRCTNRWLISREFYAHIVWISPVSQNYEGPRTVYGDPYHGYWVADATKLNSRYGTSDDLKALSDELHRRNM